MNTIETKELICTDDISSYLWQQPYTYTRAHCRNEYDIYMDMYIMNQKLDSKQVFKTEEQLIII